jgi:WS/DGAT/MGAT family acyltransferase
MHIVEGLADGRIAVVSKIHHCTIDGVSGAELLGELFDLEATPAKRPVPDGQAGGAGGLPSDLTLLAQAMVARATRPLRITKLAWKTGKAFLEVRRVRQTSDSGGAALPLTTPRTSLNQAITAHRLVAFSTISLDDVKRIKNALGTTVNDVVLALCTGALRRYLIDGDELPDDSLVATVPVSVQGSTQHKSANKVSAMFVALPCSIDDPVKRLLEIREGTKGAKEEHKALGAEVLLDWAEHAPPNVFSAAARTYTRFRLAEHHRPIHSLVISNVPGPDFPIYLGGSQLVAGFPLGPVMDGAGLNITVMSYRGVLNWGLMACRETVPSVGQLARYVPAALDELLAAAGLEPATPVGVAAAPERPKPRTRAKAPATT